MKDPTIPDAKSRKKIMFYDSEDRQIKLRVRCNFDGITQSQFFRMMITGYVENDLHLSEYIKSCKEKYQIHGLQKRIKNDQMQKQKQLLNKKFALGQEEVENIFDIIETETDL